MRSLVVIESNPFSNMDRLKFRLVKALSSPLITLSVFYNTVEKTEAFNLHMNYTLLILNCCD